MTSSLSIHLDPVGGIAGDMFVAALLDAWPDLAGGTIAAVRAAGLGNDVRIEHLAHRDDILTGSRFFVACPEPPVGNAGTHRHVHWQDLRKRLSAAPLAPAVGERAIAIFALLAEAEAGVHGMPVDETTFHEVGAWDSVADIVAAAFLIETIGVGRWSVGPLPLGSGRVRCAHGELPVPAPATARLLQGFVVHDDGRPGERVTPTGAAILKQLQACNGADEGPKRLLRTGHGFGLRRLDGMSNVLRVLAFESASVAPARATQEAVAVLNFEIDDQTAEDLAIGLDRLREIDAVLDVLQTPAFGKKGRLATAIRLLVRPNAIEEVTDACFAETRTLGVRHHLEDRSVLARRQTTTEDGIGVKLAERPDGRATAKAESDDLAAIVGHERRQITRRSAEANALARREPKEDQ